MDYNNLRDPNEKNPPLSIFRFDSYPGIPGQQTNLYPYDPLQHQQQTTSMFSSFIPTPQIPMPQAPPVPSSFAFGGPNISHPMVGHFPHHTANNDFSTIRPKFVLGKRKTNSPPLQLCKQHITEEKMAEYMSKLHINSETAPSVLEPESLKNKRLYMCEEMRKLQPEPLLPSSLLSKMQQPCTALVLWKPPSKVLPTLSSNEISKIESSNKSKEDEDDDPPLIDTVDMDNNEFVGTMDMDS